MTKLTLLAIPVRRIRKAGPFRIALSWILVCPLLLAACETNSLKPEVRVDDPDVYWDLELDHHAVTLSTTAPYDTLSLTATPRNYLGESLAGLPEPEFLSRDKERVLVTTDGRLVARGVTSGSQRVWVIATLTTGNIKHSDSVIVRVLNTPAPVPILDSFSAHPLPPDSAKLAATANHSPGAAVNPVPSLVKTLPVRAKSTTGSSITGLQVHFRSSDPLIATINATTGRIEGLRPGDVTLYASVTLYGVHKVDTLPFRVGLPVLAGVYISEPRVGQPPGIFLHPDYTVGRGAVVYWAASRFGTAELAPLVKTDVVFDDPSKVMGVGNPLAHPVLSFPSTSGFFRLLACLSTPADCVNGGNFVLGGGTLVPGDTSVLLGAMRVFPEAGVYTYRSTIHGTSGRIAVVDES